MGNNQETPKQLTEDEIRQKMQDRWNSYSNQHPEQNQQQQPQQQQQSVKHNDENIINSNNDNKNKNTTISKETTQYKVLQLQEDNNTNNNVQQIKEHNTNNIHNNAPVVQHKPTQTTINKKDNEPSISSNNNNKNEQQQQPSQSNEQPTEPPKPKVIDLENATIEKVFKITVNESNQKLPFLELYYAQLLSASQPLSFKLSNIDEIILSIINDSPYTKDLLPYFLSSYHRAVEIIDKRFKTTLTPEYQTIKSSITTYLGQIIISPQNFNITTTNEAILTSLTTYYNDTDEDELNALIRNFIDSCEGDNDSLSIIIQYIFEIIKRHNQDKHFYNSNTMFKHISFITNVFTQHEIIRNIFLKTNYFVPNTQGMGNINGKIIQKATVLAIIGNCCPFEVSDTLLQSEFPFSIKLNDSNVQNYINKLNTYIDVVCKLFDCFLCKDTYDTTSVNVFALFHHVINTNTEYLKLHPNIFMCSSIGYLMNLFYISITLLNSESSKCILNEHVNNFMNTPFAKKAITSDYLFNICKRINILYTLNNDNINFDKFDMLNKESIQEYIKDNAVISKDTHYNSITHLFFISHALLRFFIEFVEKKYTNIIQQINTLAQSGMIRNQKMSAGIIALWKAFDVYIKNPKFISSLLSFNELTMMLIHSLNNDKYSYTNDKPCEDTFNFYNDFYNHINTKSNIELSSLPNMLIENIVKSSVLIRQHSAEIYFKDSFQVEKIVYFALIYSSNVNLIHNPYLRSQIFDLILYSFIGHKNEPHLKLVTSSTYSILKSDFVQDNLIMCLIRVFIDAERVGTSNQFYEKFNIRNKVLQTIEHLFKKHEDVFKDKVITYAEQNSEDTTKMLTLLMNDFNYIIEELISHLSQIKTYQDLKDDEAKWNELSDEEKQREDMKFQENDRMVKTFIQMLNHTLNLLVVLCSCLQKFFLRLRLAERLATSLNYCLDQFTHNSKSINIKNKETYEFNPIVILTSLLKIYNCFSEFEDFIKYVVIDKANYKYNNFKNALRIKNEKQNVIDFENSEKIDHFVNELLLKAEVKAKEEEINYDDAPDEFLDPLTSILMDDPVILPSNVTVDRITIETQLINNPVDPYSRLPLSKEDLVANTELKAKIEAYKQSKQKKK